jgi:hypothetical protein
LTENKNKTLYLNTGISGRSKKKSIRKNEIDIFPDNPLNVRIKTAGTQIDMDYVFEIRR